MKTLHTGTLILIGFIMSLPLTLIADETQQAKAYPADQANSIDLNERCRPVGMVVRVPAKRIGLVSFVGNESVARAAALQLKANAFQILYTHQVGNAQEGWSYAYVRFWSCPE